MKSQPTLKSVAQAAGVSTAAVSYAFNRPERLSAQVREHILATARELAYAGPDAAARTLRTRRAGAIGVIFTVGLPYAFQDPYMLEMLGGLTEITEQTRTGLVLLPFDLATAGLDEQELRRSLDAVHHAVISGAVADGLADDHPAVQALLERRIPLVQSSETASGRCVVIDDRQGGVEIGRHLAERGHRSVTVVVSGPDEPGVLVPVVDESRLYPYSRLRLAGIREGLGGRADVRVVSAGRNAESSGRAAAASALDLPDRPTAIAADSDVLAAGVLAALRSRGLVAGRDIAVTGFDDAAFAAAAGLTTVRQPIREKGRLMGRMLLDPDLTARRVLLPIELVVRTSSGPRPAPIAEGSPDMPATTKTRPTRADEWHTDRLDLDGYLRRIGHPGPVAADEATLTALHRAHVAAITFENLDVMLGREPSVDIEEVQAKLVGRGRGGYCYEHNVLFGAVLCRLGFDVDRLLARTGDPAEHPRPRSHLVLLVRAGDRRWLADVGFGSGLLEPLPFTGSVPRRQGAWQYQLRKGDDGAWRLREHDGSRWTTTLTFTEEPQYLVDIEVANNNTATNPHSPFVQRPIVVRKDDTSVRRMLGREYTWERPGRPVQQQLLTDDEFIEKLHGEFGIPLPAADVAALVAALPARPPADGAV